MFMQCLDCGIEMVQGSVEGFGLGIEHGYEFTSDEEKKKKGIKGFFSRNTIGVEATELEYPAWYCSKCKKILMWMDSTE